MRRSLTRKLNIYNKSYAQLLTHHSLVQQTASVQNSHIRQGTRYTSRQLRWGTSLYYVSIFLDFFWPTHYVSINTVINISKHLPGPPSPFADVIYRWFLGLYQSITLLSKFRGHVVMLNSGVKFVQKVKISLLRPPWIYFSLFIL
jgi:hypothetical protein